MKKILYLGWIGYNNLGDEWMWSMFQRLSEHYLNPDKYQVIPSLPGVDVNNISAYDTIVLGGGSLLIPGYIDILHRAAKQNKKVIIWGSGHDRLNRLVINDDRTLSPEPANDSTNFRSMMQEAVGSAVFCGVRGPWTYDYLKECGVTLDRVAISGDPAMLALPPSQDKSREQAEERWIGINWGTSYNRIYGKNEREVEDELAFAAQRWIREGYKIYLYVVWGPDRESAKRLQQKIGFPDHVVFDPEIRTLESYLQLMQQFTFTVNLKLHANVLAAAANTPFICLGYRFKSYDFVHSLNLPEIIVPTHSSCLEAELLNTAAFILKNKDLIIHRIHDLRQVVTTQLEIPFTEELF